MKKKFLTGSKAFFSGIEGYSPKDTDWLVLTDEASGFSHYRQTSAPGKCLFEWKAKPKDELIGYAVSHPNPPMQAIKFLTPEFAEFIGLETKDLEALKPLFDIMDDKHKYAVSIFESYLENGTFTLTDEQRRKAYEIYLKYRENKTNK